MTSFCGLSFSNLLPLALAIFLLSICSEGNSSSINQSYNASDAETSPNTELQPSSARGPLNVTEKAPHSPATRPSIVGGTGGSLEAKGEDEEAREEQASLRRESSGQEEASDATPDVLKCGVSCTCYQQVKNHYPQYRVICNNTKQEAVILSSAVFESDGPPTWNIVTYVQVQGVTSVIVTKGFVARWTAYHSCAMDLWNAGDIVLPPGPTEKAETGAYNHKFAGLGIKNSRLAQIPHAVFADMETYGLDLENVSIPILNLHNLVYPRKNSLQYLMLTNVVVGAIQGTMDEGEQEEASMADYEGGSDGGSITLAAESSGNKKRGIWINNTQIGVIEANGLNVMSKVNMTVSLDNSEIGMIKRDGLKLMGRIVPEIQNTRVTLEGQGSIVLDEGMVLKALRNQIVLPQNIFNQWTCEQNNITDNDFIVVKLPEPFNDDNEILQESDGERFQEAQMTKGLTGGTKSTPEPPHEHNTTVKEELILTTVNDTERTAKEPSELDAFIHPTCVDNNRILNAPLEAPKEVPDHHEPPTDPAVKMSPTEADLWSNNTLETETIHPILSPNEGQRFSIAGNSTSEKHMQVHKGLAYLVLGAVGALVLIVLVLVGILVFRRKRNSRDIYQETPARDRRPSLMYMPGSSVYGNDTWPMPPAQTSLN